MDLEGIAKKHGAEVSEINKEFEKGKAVEMEHTKDEKTAEKIAKDHLFEDPCYYTKLAKMESENQETRYYAPNESEEEDYTAKDYADEMERKGEGQKIKDEEAESHKSRMEKIARDWVSIFHRTFGPGYIEDMEKRGLDPYKFFVEYYIAYLKNPEIVNKFAGLYNDKYPTHQVDIARLHKEIDKIKDKPIEGHKASVR